jgi:phospholipid:diacylglycerol acyltransferase
MSRWVCAAVGCAIAAIALGLVLNSHSLQANTPISDILSQIYLSDWYKTFMRSNSGNEEALSSDRGDHVHHPVVMVPGIVSTGLEVWKAKPCASKHFRERLWGTTVMIQNMILQPKCWAEHMSLDYNTGLDPDMIKLRPALGLEAADYLVGGYWVWAKLIKELALVGYDPNSMHMASYDWRLSLPDLEKRDHFFSKLKGIIELAKISNLDRKVVIVAHSWGGCVFMYFLKWVEFHAYEGWVRDNLHAVITIGTPFLGVPKSLTSLISGEMRDTAELSPPLAFLKNRLLSVREISKMFRSWGSIAHMLPKGGVAIWGNHSGAADDLPGKPTFGSILKFRRMGSEGSMDNVFSATSEPLKDKDVMLERALPESVLFNISSHNYTVSDSLDLLRQLAPSLMNRVDGMYSFGYAVASADLSSAEYAHPRYWSNPLESSLPDAPSLKVYSLYGRGKSAERAYYYHQCGVSEFPVCLDTGHSVPHLGISRGVQEVDGDGTVPLLSLSYLCAEGWRAGSVLNPHGVQVRCVAYEHTEPRGVLEQGEHMLRQHSGSADHVDIMGNGQLLADVVRVATLGSL